LNYGAELRTSELAGGVVEAATASMAKS